MRAKKIFFEEEFSLVHFWFFTVLFSVVIFSLSFSFR